MDVLEAIKNRRSIRTYKKQDLPQEVVDTLLKLQGGRLPRETFNLGRL
jgi:nitroreductase